MIIYIFIVLFLGSVHLKETKVKSKKIPQHLLENNCLPNLPFNSVGDIWLGDKNYTQVIDTTPRLLLIVSHKSCFACCRHELIFNQLHQFIHQKEQRLNITLGRLELSENDQFLQNFSMIKRFPQVMFFFRKSSPPAIYNDILNSNSLVKFISSFDNQVQYFKSLEKLQSNFLSPLYNAGNILEPVRVIGLFYDRKELSTEIQKFINTANQLTSRNYRIRFAILEGKNQLKLAKIAYPIWFSDYSLSSVVIQRKTNGQFTIIDLSEVIQQMQNLENEIARFAITLIDELVMKNYPSYSSNKHPILTVVLDSIYNPEKAFQYLQFIEDNIAKRFEGQLLITWIEGSLNEDKTKMLGIEGWTYETPALAFFRIEETIQVPYCLDVYNATLIISFIEDYRNKPLDYVKRKYSTIKTSDIELKQKIFWDKLPGVCEINSQNQTFVHQQPQENGINNLTSEIILIFTVNILQTVDPELYRIVPNFSERVNIFGYAKRLQICIEVQSVESQTNITLRLKDKEKVTPFEGDWRKIDQIIKFVENSTQKEIRFPIDGEVDEQRLLDYYLKIYY